MDNGQIAEDPAVLGKRKRSPLGSVSVSTADNSSFPENSNQPLTDSRAGDASLKKVRGSGIQSTGAYNQGQTHSLGAPSSFLDLPVEILQHAISFLDPLDLIRVRTVNRYLHYLLDLKSPTPIASGMTSKLPVLSQESIWSNSRRLYLPVVPEPLESETELDLVRYAYSRRCQFCGRSPRAHIPSTIVTPWNAGPGTQGVRTIWPFKVCSCADCLRPSLVKETDLMLSSASVLHPGLPYALFTPTLSYVASVALRSFGKPSGLQVTKYYYRPQIVELEDQMTASRTQGLDFYQSWYRNLEPALEIKMGNSARWEIWEASQRDLRVADPSFQDFSSQMSTSSTSSARRRPRSKQAPSVATNTTHSTWPSSSVTLGRPVTQKALPSIRYPGEVIIQSAAESSTRHTAPFALGTLDVTTNSQPKDEIVGRSKDIEFQADLMDLETAPSPGSPMETMDMSSMDNNYEPSNAIDVEVEALRPTREKLDDIAREFITRRWGGGTNLNAASAPQFAADILQFVRNKFYANQDSEDAALSLRNQVAPPEPQSGIRTRTLKLEHMKHVFETSVKPLTEWIKKDLFLCSQCDVQGKNFDAIIQHFAAKHTKSFSRGAAVVHWKSEWPEDPPFRLNPSAQAEHQTQPFHLPPHARGVTPTLSTGSARIRAPERASPRPSVNNDMNDVRSVGSTDYSNMHTAHPALLRGPLHQPLGNYHIQRDQVFEDVKRAWSMLERVSRMPDSLRFFLVIHFAAQQFRDRSNTDLELPLFLDCIANKLEARSFHELGALNCKSCRVAPSAQDNESSVPDGQKLVPIDLLKHFQKTHIKDRPSRSGLRNRDWKYDMIDLPDNQTVREATKIPDLHSSIYDLLITQALSASAVNPAQVTTSSSAIVHENESREQNHTLSASSDTHSLPQRPISPPQFVGQHPNERGHIDFPPQLRHPNPRWTTGSRGYPHRDSRTEADPPDTGAYQNLRRAEPRTDFRSGNVPMHLRHAEMHPIEQESRFRSASYVEVDDHHTYWHDYEPRRWVSQDQNDSVMIDNVDSQPIMVTLEPSRPALVQTNDAENFLNNFDLMTAENAESERSRPASTASHPRFHGPDNTERIPALMDRRSNLSRSQHQSRDGSLDSRARIPAESTISRTGSNASTRQISSTRELREPERYPEFSNFEPRHNHITSSRIIDLSQTEHLQQSTTYNNAVRTVTYDDRGLPVDDDEHQAIAQYTAYPQNVDPYGRSADPRLLDRARADIQAPQYVRVMRNDDRVGYPTEPVYRETYEYVREPSAPQVERLYDPVTGRRFIREYLDQRPYVEYEDSYTRPPAPPQHALREALYYRDVNYVRRIPESDQPRQSQYHDEVPRYERRQ